MKHIHFDLIADSNLQAATKTKVNKCYGVEVLEDVAKQARENVRSAGISDEKAKVSFYCSVCCLLHKHKQSSTIALLPDRERRRSIVANTSVYHLYLYIHEQTGLSRVASPAAGILRST